ncbi:MAG: hypothetical protein ACREFO_08760 [Acetobacteraceae bacterium]
MPRGARLIESPVSVAPGFEIGNVFVMAGVPQVMRAMFETLVPHLEGGARVPSRAVHAVGVAEGTDAKTAERAIAEVTVLMQSLGGNPVAGERPP